eukprot:CAMPEP_0116565100 /NCGR_PEP_ID=MMETSP0397-20121206/13714_1 /TAXON_ID=216820 /ORGANISM="Cyclophora tenuis, Strain ECT3854" /LENGTH=199 /DNA_ID=CAMNT_0004091843 /DNA_START=27 /DNA_END=626 /DNA_ORIENTATION=-
MTRAFTPPDTLSKDDIRTIADVRRDIWTNAFWGLGVGSLSGAAAHGLGQLAQTRGIVRGLNRNTAFLSVLGGGALGSFLMATAAGKNQVHNLHPIFEVGKKEIPPPRDGTPYQQALQAAQENYFDAGKQQQQQQERDVVSTARQQAVVSSAYADDDFNIHKRRLNRVMRRKTLQSTFERGGLSDSHGGSWVEDERSGRH